MIDSNSILFTTIQFHVIGLNKRSVVTLHRDDVSISTGNYIQRKRLSPGSNTWRIRVIGDRFKEVLRHRCAPPILSRRSLRIMLAIFLAVQRGAAYFYFYPQFDIVIYALNFKLSYASMMKSAKHFDKSLDSTVNKLQRNVLFASRIVATCENPVGYWSIELFTKRLTVPRTTFWNFQQQPDCWKGTPFNNGARNWGRQDSWFFSWQVFLLFPYTDQLRI